MPIPLTTTLINPIAPSDTTAVGATHFDIYGNGGYRSITTSGTGSVDDQLNAQVSEQRRRVGMLVYDTRLDKYYRLTQISPGTWTEEDFGNSGGVTSVGMTVPTGLSVSPSTITDTGVFNVEVDTAVLSGGLVKVVGGAFDTAVAGSDYVAVNHSQPYTSIDSVPASRLVGRYSATSGDLQPITIGDGLNLSAAGELTADGSGGTVTGVSGIVPITVATPDEGQTFIVSHQNSGVQAGTYGNGQTVPAFTVDAKGHVTSVSATPIDGFLSTGGGTLTGPLTGTSASFSNVTLSGNLTVNGSQTIINSTTLSVDDKNVVLGDVADPTDATANGGGITLRGAPDKSITWTLGDAAWTSSEHFNLAATKSFNIGGNKVLDANELGAGVTTSALQSVGVLTGGTWQADSIGLAYGGTGTNLSTFAAGTIFMKGAGNTLVAAQPGSDYYDTTSTIDGGAY